MEFRNSKYILKKRTPVPIEDALLWGQWFTENPYKRIVARDEFPDGVRVSTVFLGLDHAYEGPPLLFETMIFEGPNDGYQKRYSTWEEAEEGYTFAKANAHRKFRMPNDALH